MTRTELIKIVNKYSEIENQYPSTRVISGFLRANNVITPNLEKSQVNLMHWNDTANSYLKIPQVDSIDMDEKFNGLIEQEIDLTNKLRDSHLNILIKIANNELELGIR